MLSGLKDRQLRPARSPAVVPARPASLRPVSPRPESPRPASLRPASVRPASPAVSQSNLLADAMARRRPNLRDSQMDSSRNSSSWSLGDQTPK